MTLDEQINALLGCDCCITQEDVRAVAIEVGIPHPDDDTCDPDDHASGSCFWWQDRHEIMRRIVDGGRRGVLPSLTLAEAEQLLLRRDELSVARRIEDTIPLG